MRRTSGVAAVVLIVSVLVWAGCSESGSATSTASTPVEKAPVKIERVEVTDAQVKELLASFTLTIGRHPGFTPHESSWTISVDETGKAQKDLGYIGKSDDAREKTSWQLIETQRLMLAKSILSADFFNLEGHDNPGATDAPFILIKLVTPNRTHEVKVEPRMADAAMIVALWKELNTMLLPVTKCGVGEMKK